MDMDQLGRRAQWAVVGSAIIWAFSLFMHVLIEHVIAASPLFDDMAYGWFIVAMGCQAVSLPRRPGAPRHDRVVKAMVVAVCAAATAWSAWVMLPRLDAWLSPYGTPTQVGVLVALAIAWVALNLMFFDEAHEDEPMTMR